MAEEGQGQSKSAKRRAAQKRAKESAEVPAQEAAPPAAPPAPAASQPKAKGKAKAKPEPAPAAAPAPAPAKASPPAAEPKGKAKAKAKAEPTAKAGAKAEPKPEPKPEPKAEPTAPAAAAAKPGAKSKSKAAAKPKSKAQAAPKAAEEEPPRRDPSPDPFVVMDDGTGGEWEISTGLTKKQQKRKDKAEQQAAEAKASGLKPGQTPQYIPGMAPPGAVAAAAGKAGPGVSQALAASAAQAAAAATASATAAAAAAAAAEKEKESNQSTATVKVPEAKIGIVIGPKGSKIKLIQEKTGARVDTTGDVFTITGPPQGVREAEMAVRELVDKGYTALEYDDFQENFVAVHPSYFPEIIGKGGVVIRKIKDELGVAVKIPEAPKNPPAGKKYKVTLAGTNAQVEKAKDVINEIMMYYHHLLTHEGLVHEEVEVEKWAYPYIIGKAGSELRHIQNNYKVKLNIPRDHSLNQKVVIVGDPSGVERAKVYVEKLVWNAEHAPRGRGAAEQAEDVWGDEGDDEPWMKDYIYKR